jgi:hypothetical protein
MPPSAVFLGGGPGFPDRPGGAKGTCCCFREAILQESENNNNKNNNENRTCDPFAPPWIEMTIMIVI